MLHFNLSTFTLCPFTVEQHLAQQTYREHRSLSCKHKQLDSENSKTKSQYVCYYFFWRANRWSYLLDDDMRISARDSSNRHHHPTNIQYHVDKWLWSTEMHVALRCLTLGAASNSDAAFNVMDHTPYLTLVWLYDFVSDPDAALHVACFLLVSTCLISTSGTEHQCHVSCHDATLHTHVVQYL